MSRRPPSQAPALPGYEFENLLGSGGFADVFLYRQQRPMRRVAIKVMLSTVHDRAVQRQFEAEANVMASMSTHPSIVSIYQADVSADGRPYIVMEYCSRPNYGVRFRRERISVAEALRVGVQIAGAVETAHRAGILHRDIKPANILVTDYNRPALTDFGISITAGQGEDIEDSQGMSIPWSPPEVFADPPRADVRSDVFSLAATVYSLLGSRTPFERVGQRNTASDLISRIETEPLPPLTRPDVPPELNRVLAVAMAKNPAGRYDSALAFGRALQEIERALALPITQMDVLDDRAAPSMPASDDDDLDSHTRIRRVSIVDPEGPSPSTSASGEPTGQASKPQMDRFAGVAPALGAAPSSPAYTPSPDDEPGEATMLRPTGSRFQDHARAVGFVPTYDEDEETEATAGRRVPVWPFVVLAVLAIVGLGIGSTLAVRTLFTEAEPSRPTEQKSKMNTAAAPLGDPGNLTVDMIVPESPGVPGRAQISWSQADGAAESTYYVVQWVDLPKNYEKFGKAKEVYGRQSTVTLAPPGLPEACVNVTARDRDGRTSGTVQTCLKKKG